MMKEHEPTRRSRSGRGWKSTLLIAKFIGLIGFLGGLAGLAALGLLGPRPHDLAGWEFLRASMRSIFFPVLFSGLVLTVCAGLLLLAREPKTYLSLRWFRLKTILLVLFVPSSHLWARGLVIEFDEALEAGRLNDLPNLWRQIAFAFLATLVIFLVIATIGKLKPRLGAAAVRPASKDERASKPTNPESQQSAVA